MFCWFKNAKRIILISCAAFLFMILTQKLFFKKLTLLACPKPSPHLMGNVIIRTTPVPIMEDLTKQFTWLSIGGHFSPEPRQKIAIIVPYRNRPDQLLLFLQHMHPFLKKQVLDYTVFVIEQHGKDPFNRAKLLNVGFKEALKLNNFDCFIFHDVDMLPENYNNIYNCYDNPKRMVGGRSISNYSPIYKTYFGGVTSFKKEQFEKVNGYSNNFWGWGLEDDNMYERVIFHNFTALQPNLEISRYTTLKHKKEEPNKKGDIIFKQDMLEHFPSGLSDLNYTVVQFNSTLLNHRILVELYYQNFKQN